VPANLADSKKKPPSELEQMKTIIAAASGFVLGAVAIAAVAGVSANQFMIQQSLSPLAFEDTVESIKQTVTDKGWKLPKVYRLDETMKQHGYEVNPVAVLELCHAEHAYKILRNDDSLMVTPFMPCRISIYQRDNGDVVIARMNSGLMSNLFNREIASVMGLATQQVEGIIAAATLPAEAIAQRQ
jgi:uncharacterized protein (DUF302 family)